MAPPSDTSPPPSGPAPGASSGATSSVRGREQPPAWPSNVPSQMQALEVLRGQLNLVVSLPGARKLQEKLTQPEREVLQEESAVPPLREAIAVRWRLAAAQDLLLTSGGRVDTGALNLLLAEVEQALEALGAASSEDPALALAMDRTWETLSQEAVDFFSTLQSASAAQPTAGAHLKPRRSEPSTSSAGKVTFQPQPSARNLAPPASRKVLFAALGVVVLGVVGYHVFEMSQAPRTQSGYPGAPPYTVITQDAGSGSLLMSSVRVGELSAEQRAWLKQQEAQGMRIQQQGPNSYLLSPAKGAPGPRPPATP